MNLRSMFVRSHFTHLCKDPQNSDPRWRSLIWQSGRTKACVSFQCWTFALCQNQLYYFRLSLYKYISDSSSTYSRPWSEWKNWVDLSSWQTLLIVSSLSLNMCLIWRRLSGNTSSARLREGLERWIIGIAQRTITSNSSGTLYFFPSKSTSANAIFSTRKDVFPS